MGNCNEVREQLSLYIDGMLEPGEAEGVENHLKACPECSKEVEEIRRLIRECGEMEEKEPPEYLAPMIINSIRKQARGKNTRFSRWLGNRRIVSAAAAVLLVLVVAKGVMPALENGFWGGMKAANDMSTDQTQEEPVAEEYGLSSQEALNKAMAPEGRGASSEAEFDVAEDGAGGQIKMGREMFALTADEAQPPQQVEQKEAEAGRKIINNAELSLNVENFDESFRAIQQVVEKTGGFIQSSNSYVSRSNVGEDGRDYKEGHVALRIPGSEFYRALDEIEHLGKTTNKSVFGNDVTKQYMDMEARLKSKEVQEERLLDILSKAAKVEDILRIENELNRVRTEIEMYVSQMRDWDNLVQYSTINVFIREVEPKDKQVSPPKMGNLWDRVKKGFILTTNGILDIVEALIVGIGFALPVIIIAGAGYLVWRGFRNKKSIQGR
ncbi:MAG: hypothetical protein HPY66_0729 [Firmicutes bacterium]|nr:hypothetical protein [Bacillota bacterium]MDI6705662.1 DUF4349 domain-containing protein [Bacillota bacterium]